MEPIEFDEATRAKLTLLSLIVFFALVCGLVVLWKLFETDTGATPIDSLASRCREDAGVVIEGVNENENGDINHFAVCVPYEALTCIDVE